MAAVSAAPCCRTAATPLAAVDVPTNTPFCHTMKRDEGGGGVNGGGKAAGKVVVVLRQWLAEEVMMVSAVKRGGSG
nr:hypothetical protein [Tanacetum cinerariifolium]